LLWMHEGLGYIYRQCRVTKGEPARERQAERGLAGFKDQGLRPKRKWI
jgi:hypothetical protein